MASALDGVRAGDWVVGVQVADAPAAAVVEDDDRQVVVGRFMGRGGWPVDPHRNVGEVAVSDGPFLDPQVGQHFRGRLQQPEPLACDLDAVGRGEGQRERVEQRLERRIDTRPGAGRAASWTHRTQHRNYPYSAARNAASPDPARRWRRAPHRRSRRSRAPLSRRCAPRRGHRRRPAARRSGCRRRAAGRGRRRRCRRAAGRPGSARGPAPFPAAGWTCRFRLRTNGRTSAIGLGVKDRARRRSR